MPAALQDGGEVDVAPPPPPPKPLQEGGDIPPPAAPVVTPPPATSQLPAAEAAPKPLQEGGEVTVEPPTEEAKPAPEVEAEAKARQTLAEYAKKPWWERSPTTWFQPETLKETVPTQAEQKKAEEIKAQKPLQEGGEVKAPQEAPKSTLPTIATDPNATQEDKTKAIRAWGGNNAEDIIVNASREPANKDADEQMINASMAALKDKDYAPSTDEYVGRLAVGAVKGLFDPGTWRSMGKFGQTAAQFMTSIMPKLIDGEPLNEQDNAVARTMLAGVEGGNEFANQTVESMVNYALAHDTTGAIRAIMTSLGQNPDDPTRISMEEVAKLPEEQQRQILAAKIAAKRANVQTAIARSQGEISPDWAYDWNMWSGRTLDTNRALAEHGIHVDPEAQAGVASTLNYLNVAIPVVGEALAPVTGALLGRGLTGSIVEGAGRTLGESLGTPGIAETVFPKMAAKAAKWGVRGALDVAGVSHIPFPLNIAAMPLIEPISQWMGEKAGAAAATVGNIPRWMRENVWTPMSKYIQQRGEDIRTGGSGVEANFGPLAQLFGGVAEGAVKGAVGAVPFAAGAETPEEAGQTIGGGAILGAGMHVLPEALDASMSSLFHQTGRFDAPMPDHGDYGTTHGGMQMDQAHNDFVSTLDPRMQQVINNLRHWFPNIEIYFLGKDQTTGANHYADAVQRLQDSGILEPGNLKSRGLNVMIDPDTKKAMVLVDGNGRYTGGSILDTAHHEIGHSIYWSMTPEQRQIFKDAGASRFDMDQFTRRYVRKIAGAENEVGYTDLPTQAEIDSGAKQHLPNLPGITQDTMNEELGAETVAALLHGEPLQNFSRDPTRLRQLQMGLGRVLNKMGMNITPENATTLLGVRPGMDQMFMMDGIIRDFFKLPENQPKTTGGPDTGSGPTPTPKGKKVINRQPEIGGGSHGAPQEEVDAAVRGLQGMGFRKREAQQMVDNASGANADQLIHSALQRHAGGRAVVGEAKAPATPQQVQQAEAPVFPHPLENHRLMDTEQLARRALLGDAQAKQTLIERHGNDWLEKVKDPEVAAMYKRLQPEDAQAQQERIDARAKAQVGAEERAAQEGTPTPKPVDAARIAELRAQAEREVPRVGYMPPEMEEEPPPRRKFRNAAEHEEAINQRHIHLVMAEHDRLLPQGDRRVRLQLDPDTGRRLYNGTHFDQSDPVHQWLLGKMDPQERAFLLQAQQHVANGTPMNMNYTHAPRMGRKWIPSGPEREAEYGASPAEKRAAGEDVGQVGNRTFLPISVGVGADGQGLTYGLAIDKVLGNAVKASRAMRNKTPYGKIDRATLPIMLDDLRKVGENHRAGWKGDGSAPLQGTLARPVNVNPRYVPSVIPAEHAQFINMLLNARDTLRGPRVTKEGKLTAGGKALEFAEANQGYTSPHVSRGIERTEVNPMRERLEKTKAFAGRELEHGFEQFRTDLMRDTRDKAPAIRKHGLQAEMIKAPAPERRYAAAGFMPGDEVEGPNGEQERIKAAAIRYPDGKIFTGPMHAHAFVAGEREGRSGTPHPDIDEGYVTDSGRFINREEGWRLAKANKQLKRGATNLAEYKGMPSQRKSGALSEDIRMAGPAPERRYAAAGFMPLEEPEDYRGSHQAPYVEGGGPMHDPKDIYPDDFYGPNGFRYYSDFGNAYDREAHEIVRNSRYRPAKQIRVYRAIPKEAPGEINRGDWVTTTRAYAKEHGAAHIDGPFRIISQAVHARDLFTDGNSIHEWGYDPQEYNGQIEREYKAKRQHFAQGGMVPITGEDIPEAPPLGPGRAYGRDTEPPKAGFMPPEEEESVPHKPGSEPIPEGHVRLYHQTTPENLDKIRREGLHIRHAKGIEGPKAIYADEAGFYGKPETRPTVEFHVPREQWDPPFVRADSVPLENIIAAHQPWHARARYAESHPEVIRDILAGNHDDLLNHSQYGPSIRYIKAKYGGERPKAGYMPLAGEMAAGYPEAEREGRLFISPLHGAKQFEIDDRDMKWVPAPKGAYEKTLIDWNAGNTQQGWSRLGDIIEHPRLFKNYPEMADMQVQLRPDIRYAGYYQPPEAWETEHIALRDISKSTLAHEIQHAVQFRENWPRGSNPSRMAEGLMKDRGIQQDLHVIYNSTFPELDPSEFPTEDQYHEYLLNRAEHQEKWNNYRIANMAMSRYREAPGEVEARTAGQRAVMPSGWRLSPEEHATQLKEEAHAESGYRYQQMLDRDLEDKGPAIPGSKVGYMPPELEEAPKKKGKKAPPPKIAPPDLRSQHITPEEQAVLDKLKEDGQRVLEKYTEGPTNIAPESLGERKLPAWVKLKEQVGEFFSKKNPTLDFNNEDHREGMSIALVHDILRRIISHPESFGWYNRNVRAAMQEIGKLNPRIATDPLHNLVMRLCMAVTSQDQKVHPNFESAYRAYLYWTKTGRFPDAIADTTGKFPLHQGGGRDYFGGGTKAEAMEGNFAKLNKLWDMHGDDKMADKLQERMAIRDIDKVFGTNISEPKNYETEFSAILGPKIGSFFNNLSGLYHTLTSDVWATRTFNRLAGKMMAFGASKLFRNPDPELTPYLTGIRNAIADGTMENATKAQQKQMLREANALDKYKDNPDALDRETAMELAPTIRQWASEQYGRFAANTPDPTGKVRSFWDKRPINYLAKNIHLNFSDLEGGPRSPGEREAFRDIMQRAIDKLAAEGIHITPADAQAVVWYMEQDLFSYARFGKGGTGSYDYLDAAYALRHKYQGATPNEFGKVPEPEEEPSAPKAKAKQARAPPAGRMPEGPLAPVQRREGLALPVPRTVMQPPQAAKPLPQEPELTPGDTMAPEVKTETQPPPRQPLHFDFQQQPVPSAQQPVTSTGVAPGPQPVDFSKPPPVIGPNAMPAATGNPAAFIMHHTGGGTLQSTIETLKERGLGVEYIMDRDGTIYVAGKPGAANILPGWGTYGQGLNNKNIVGMEVVAKDNNDVTPAQVAAAQKFIRENYPNTPIFGHGEVNPGHKEADEGLKIASAIRAERAGQQPGAGTRVAATGRTDTTRAALASAASIMREEGPSDVQDGRREVFGFREGQDSEYPEMTRLRGAGDEAGVRKLATESFIKHANEAGSGQLNDVGLKAQLMSLAHMRGVAGARAILNAAGTGRLDNSGRADQLDPRAVAAINAMDRATALRRINLARTFYDQKIHGPDYWSRFGSGLADRYAREEQLYAGV